MFLWYMPIPCMTFTVLGRQVRFPFDNFFISYFRYEVKLMVEDEHTVLSRIRYTDRSSILLRGDESSKVLSNTKYIIYNIKDITTILQV